MAELSRLPEALNVALHHWVAPVSPIGVSRVFLSASLGATGTLGNGSSVLVTLIGP